LLYILACHEDPLLCENACLILAFKEKLAASIKALLKKTL